MFATFLAFAAVIAFLVANVQKYGNEKDRKITNAVPMPKIHGYTSAFSAGVLLSNGLFHFLHGILGYGEFPAPFAKVLGHGIPADISNIVWGIFNFTAAFVLIMRCRKSFAKWMLAFLLIIGAIIIALPLRFVLLSATLEHIHFDNSTI